MKLWRITRNGQTGWDQYAGFVIRAPDEATAREFAAGVMSDWAYDSERNVRNVWTNSEMSLCEELLLDGEAGIILSDFNAG